MRGLAEDTKKLSLNNSTSNNNNNNNSKTTTNKRPSTSTASSAASTATTSSKSNTRFTNTIKNSNSKINTQKQDTKSSSGSVSSSSSNINNTGVTNPATGALQKQQKAQQQKQAAKLQQTQAKQQQNNNATILTKPATATTAAATTIALSTTTSSSASSSSTPAASTTIAIPKASHANTTEEIAGGVQDTIYLCNFRVSVDGEWLCLKELQDIDLGQTNQQQHHTIGNGNTTTSGGGGNGQRSQSSSSGFGQRHNTGTNKRYSGFSGFHSLEDNGILALQNLIGRRFTETNNSLPLTHLLFTNNTTNNSDTVTGDWSNLLRDPAEIERSNLVNICKLVVKELLEQSLRYGRMLDSDHLPLQHFFIVIEHVLGHGLRPKKGLLGPRKELWDLLQSVENYCPEAQDITTSVRDLPTVRTHIGRARAWLRIALMQKKLADYLQALIEHRDDTLYDYYEPYALMLSDEIVVIMGILVGLNVIDCNLCVKEEDLDSQQGVIDFSLYLRSSSRNADNEEETNAQPIKVNGEQPNMIAVLDQKNYIEELNRHLNATVTNLQAKIETLTTTNALMKEDLAIARNSLLALQAENQAMRQNANTNHGATSLTSVQSDASSNSSGSGNKITIDSLTTELNDERKKCAELEKELKLQVSLKAESDMAMKLLEKDIHEKQDTIVSLRRQLDDIKQINLEMYRKLQECEATVKHKTELLSKLETQKEDMANTILQLEEKWCNDKSDLGEILKTTSQTLSTKVTASEERAARAEAETRIEREWRTELQDRELKLKENVASLQNCIKELTEEVKQNEKLKMELEKARKQWSEAQTTLEELGIQLSVNKLKVSELEEREKRQRQLNSGTSTTTSQANTSAEGLSGATAGIWAPDSIVTHCGGCKKEFTLARRKHHCRNCGDIFCKACSGHTLPLLNEQGLGKPVRVCDGCYATKK